MTAKLHGPKNRGHALSTAFEITMLALLLAGSAGAATLTVNASGGAMYLKIQDAINNATAGDTILVYGGTYYENVNVDRQLTLRGLGMPVVDARGSGSAITLAADGIWLEGFGARGGGGGYPEAGIKVTSSSNTLRGNNASSNSENGISLSSSTNNTLIGNIASSNTNNGISLDSSSNNTLSGNNASSNYWNGIFLMDSSSNRLSNNTLSNTLRGYLSNNSAIVLYYSSNNILSGNNASNNLYGIYLHGSSNNKLSGNNASSNYCGIILYESSSNTLKDNNASSNNESGIFVTYSSNNKIYNNIFNNTNNYYSYSSKINTWNTSLQSSPNIINGSFLGGNVWANPTGTGFSQTCTDGNSDGICDSPYTLDSNNRDYLPLALASVSQFLPYPQIEQQ